MYPISGTNSVYVVFIFWKIESLIVLFCYFYLFQNGLIDLKTPKGWHFLKKKINSILHKMLNLGFRNFRPIFIMSVLFLVATLFCTYGMTFSVLTFGYKGVTVLPRLFFRSKILLRYAQNFQWVQNSIFPNGKHIFFNSVINS